MAILFMLLFWIVFQLLIGSHKLLFGIGLIVTFSVIIFLYIKSVLNFFQIDIKGDKIQVSQLGTSLGSSSIKTLYFETDVTNSNKKKYRRILFDFFNHKVIVTNFEHNQFDAFFDYLVKSKKIKNR